MTAVRPCLRSSLCSPRCLRMRDARRHRGLRPNIASSTADPRARGPAVRRRRAATSVRVAHPQSLGRAIARCDQRRRRQRHQRQDGSAASERVCARRLGLRRDRRLAQEPGRSRNVLLHATARLLRRAHRTAAQRRRHRRGAVSRTQRTRLLRALAAMTSDDRSPNRRRRRRAERSPSGLHDAQRRSESQLGTGHGHRESSPAQYVEFRRASSDSRRNNRHLLRLAEESGCTRRAAGRLHRMRDGGLIRFLMDLCRTPRTGSGRPAGQSDSASARSSAAPPVRADPADSPSRR